MNYTKEELTKRGVHELRVFAREIGVRAPTDMKKHQIIEEILQVQSGIKEPYFSTAGRPAIKRKLEIKTPRPSIDKRKKQRKEKSIKRMLNKVEEMKNMLTKLLEEEE